MKFFGIISLLLAVAIGVWWMSKNIQTVQSGNGTSGTYQDAIDSAHKAANSISN